MVMGTTGETPNLDVALVRPPLSLPLVLLLEIRESIGAAASPAVVRRQPLRRPNPR